LPTKVWGGENTVLLLSCGGRAELVPYDSRPPTPWGFQTHSQSRQLHFMLLYLAEKSP